MFHLNIKKMKTTTFASLMLFMVLCTTVFAQKTTSTTGEKYGKTINVGLGIGYYGYVNHSVPVISLNYEIDVAKNFTLAPFISLFSYTNYYYYGTPQNGYMNYGYHQTVIPVGVKGTYYFDDLLNANPKWDFYLAGSFGFTIVNSYWDPGYYGNGSVYQGASILYLALHIGSEYHFNKTIGAFLDLSTGVSTIGIAIHH
jgi:hypothetical protein